MSITRVSSARAGRSTRRHVVVLCLGLLLGTACASAPRLAGDAGPTTEALLSGDLLDLGDEPPQLVAPDDVLAVSPEMRRFLDAHVAPRAADAARLRQLIEAIISSGDFGLEYDETTRTAAATFAARRGNCLSFSNMFVALAREVGLDVAFQEVDVPPDWSRREDVFVLSRHVNVRADVATTGEHVVDFNLADFSANYDRRVITDRRALAHFFNNVAVERLAAGDHRAVFAYLRAALVEGDVEFSPAWTSLGILYLREGLTEHGEAAFLRALAADPADEVALSNLVGLYHRLGRAGEAAAVRRRVSRHRMGNPYYRAHLAEEAMAAGRHDRAIAHLRFAARAKPGEDRFLFQLALAHLRNGDAGAAERWLRRAREVAATDELRGRYSSKIDALIATSGE